MIQILFLGFNAKCNHVYIRLSRNHLKAKKKKKLFM